MLTIAGVAGVRGEWFLPLRGVALIAMLPACSGVAGLSGDLGAGDALPLDPDSLPGAPPVRLPGGGGPLRYDSRIDEMSRVFLPVEVSIFGAVSWGGKESVLGAAAAPSRVVRRTGRWGASALNVPPVLPGTAGPRLALRRALAQTPAPPELSAGGKSGDLCPPFTDARAVTGVDPAVARPADWYAPRASATGPLPGSATSFLASGLSGTGGLLTRCWLSLEASPSKIPPSLPGGCWGDSPAPSSGDSCPL